MSKGLSQDLSKEVSREGSKELSEESCKKEEKLGRGAEEGGIYRWPAWQAATRDHSHFPD